jgi:hypothetical protein
MFTDEEKGRTLNFAEALVRAQPWRAHGGSLARVVAFLSDGAHVVFFEFTFRVEVRELALHVDLHAACESAPLPLRGAGGAFLVGLTVAPLAALGYELPNCMVDGSAVTLQAYLGAGATSTGFAGTWRGDAVVIKMYHASAALEVAALELTALLAAADVSGVCQLRGAGDGFLLLAPRGVVAYSLRADAAAAPRARASSAGLWSLAHAAAEPSALPAVASDPARPGEAKFCDLVDALAGLHAAGWVHRDPRPANSFRDAAGRFFLADLGSAARVGDAAAAADARPWVMQYVPLAALHVAAGDTRRRAPRRWRRAAGRVQGAHSPGAGALTSALSDGAPWPPRIASSRRATCQAHAPAPAGLGMRPATRAPLPEMTTRRSDCVERRLDCLRSSSRLLRASNR